MLDRTVNVGASEQGERYIFESTAMNIFYLLYEGKTCADNVLCCHFSVFKLKNCYLVR